MKYSDKIGLKFIKKSLRVLKYENIINVIGLTENSPDCEEKKQILDLCHDEIIKRDKKYNRKHNICQKN